MAHGGDRTSAGDANAGARSSRNLRDYLRSALPMAQIRALVAALGAGVDTVTEPAAQELAKLAFGDDAAVVAIVEAGGIAPLVELVRDGSEDAKEAAAWALSNLALNDDNEMAIVEAGAIVPLVELVRGGSEGAKEQAAAALAKPDPQRRQRDGGRGGGRHRAAGRAPARRQRVRGGNGGSGAWEPGR